MSGDYFEGDDPTDVKRIQEHLASKCIPLPIETFEKILKVVEYVSMGRGYIGVEPYPDATARFALGELQEFGEEMTKPAKDAFK
jgi:hypothetical protein